MREWMPVKGKPWEGRASVDRKSTRLNSSHSQISYAVFCLKKLGARHAVQVGWRRTVRHSLCAGNWSFINRRSARFDIFFTEGAPPKFHTFPRQTLFLY